jgi:hypothetical protein
MRFRSILRAADGDGGGTTGAVPPVAPAAPAPPAATPAPPVDKEAIAAEARKALLAELGVTDPDQAKAALKAQKDAEDARLTEAERQAKALKASLEEVSKAQAKADKAEAEVKVMKAQNLMRDKLDSHGVAPSARVMVEALYSSSSQAKDFDEAKFFEAVRKDHPSLFGSAATAAPSTTSPPPVGSGSMLPRTNVVELPNALKTRPAAMSSRYARG